jgi:acetyl esterase/lipase
MRISVIGATAVAAGLLSLGTGRGQVKESRIATANEMTTPAGVRFAMLGERPGRPAPVIFQFGGAARDALEIDSFNTIGVILARSGFLSVSVDLPCHGLERRPGEPANAMEGWRTRIDAGDTLMPAFTARASAVLDYLIAQGYADRGRVVAGGSSRGGFSALHLAAAEPRIRLVIAISPLTDLLAIREFKGAKRPEAARALDVMTLTDKLAGRLVWLCIGHNDVRVGTQHAIDFALKLMALSPAVTRPMDHFWSNDEVKLILAPSQGATGHSTHRTAHEEAAAWVLRWLGAK